MKSTRRSTARTGFSTVAVLALALGGCGAEPVQPSPPSSVDPNEVLFDLGHMVEISIDMAPNDWDSLRNSVNSVDELLGPGCMDGPRPSHYEYYPATVTIDGQKITQVGVRKKGFLGSASTTKPSLKVDFEEYVDAQEFAGVEKLTLNNANQDVSLIKQCMAFKAFRDAGVPASRCNFAHVTVNGKDLGVYANVESITKRMLRRFFADDSGKLYEGQLSDFRSDWSATYENKDAKDTDRSDIDAVVAALAKSDAEVPAALGALVDLDAFRTFWAMETLVAAWDGYTSNLNNHYVYHDPQSGKMFFLPWGPDVSFDADDDVRPKGRPQSVSASAAIPGRLYGLPEERSLYVEKMNEILANKWKEKDLLATVDTVETLITPFVPANIVEPVGAGIQGVRDFVTERRSTIIAELSPSPPDWAFPPPVTACYTPVGKVSGTFKTTWDTTRTMNPFKTGTGTLDLEVPTGNLVSVPDAGAAAGLDLTSGLGVRAQIQVVGIFPPESKIRVAILFINPEQFVKGKSITFDWQGAFGAAVDVPDGVNAEQIGLFNHGTVTFDDASMEPGGAVSGSFTADLISL